MTWYHFSFRKKRKKKSNLAPRATKRYPMYPYNGAVWIASTPKQPESIGKCECCGKDIYNHIYECELCGNKTCEDCMMIITRLNHMISFAAGTIYAYPSTIPYQAPKNPSASHKEMHICVSCTDLLKLSLRIASTQGYQIEKEEE